MPTEINELAINHYNSELNPDYIVWKGNHMAQHKPAESIVPRYKSNSNHKLRSKSTSKRNNYVRLKSFHEERIGAEAISETPKEFALPPISTAFSHSTQNKEEELINSISKLMANPASMLSATKSIRKHHPLFRKLSSQGTKIVFSNGRIIRLKGSEVLYKQNRRENVAYIVLYGKIAVWTIDEGVLGTVDLHDSVGEEAFIAKNYKHRYFIITKVELRDACAREIVECWQLN
eukprot:TRINITY_DN14053_c0_g2_i1.p1 TRINITY_DN14053_c0_g2~~TRINITY_DN14053_c0_g2_i1.p1  ORF type:complete len:233 (+),score=31.29 TRINITY_DN14053_c0_g2_i1:408-1106(+)